ncbi:MAG: iron ABC transporter permease [Candidatus Methanomethylophilaceae archaeon]|nr:iron ABC transporter permease [Candidatus Methanomethylophilaceae archaeon]MBP5394563.1 iron ABC transporter permease [Candidatus Methanomethylophilaceae archaeon]
MTEPTETAAQKIEDEYESGSPESDYIASRKRSISALVILGTMTFFAMAAALSLGAIDIPLWDTIKILLNKVTGGLFGPPSESYYTSVIFKIRMPRILLCMLTGLSLGLAGAVMQGLLRNPLVSPFTLGVSTAASFGAALAIVFGTSLFGSAVYYTSFQIMGQTITIDELSKTIMAFVVGLLSIGIVLGLTRRSAVSRSTLILSGVIISYIFQAGIMMLKYVSNDSQLRDITMWMMGGLSGATWGTLIVIIPVVVICGIYLEKIAIDINALSSGDDIASNLGVNVAKLRRNGLLTCTLMTCVCIAFTGTIGFVGLMSPHICRRIFGNDARILFPASALFGALLLLVSDLFSRLIMRPAEWPVGIIMYIIGGAFFIYLVFGKKLGRSDE